MGSTWQSPPAQQDYEAAESMLQHSRAGRNNVSFPPLGGYQPSDPSHYVQQPAQSLRSVNSSLFPSSYSPPSPAFPLLPTGASGHLNASLGETVNLLPPPDVRRSGPGLSLPRLYGQEHRHTPPRQGQNLSEVRPPLSDQPTRFHQAQEPHDHHLVHSRSLRSSGEEYWGGPNDADGDDFASVKEEQDEGDDKPSWAFEKTKAGKDRKRLPLACIACRRKKIRCSGEKPACKHCVRAKMPCVYKITTRKAAPRTDYMAMLDKRLKRMEERIIRIVPKNQSQHSKIPRASVRPSALRDGHGNKKRDADEAFDAQVENWVKSNPHPHSFKSLTLEEVSLYKDGIGQLPAKEMQIHLSEVFFDYVYGQSYHILHQPSYMRKLHADELPPVLILAICAIAARFSNHPDLDTEPAYLRGEIWAAPARGIVLKYFDEPNILLLTVCLILALHEFGTCQGGRSWMLAGMAIRMAHALQLHRELDHDPIGGENEQKVALSFTDREIRRRVMWASFMMDRFTASGTERPMYNDEDDIKACLPIVEAKFNAELSGPTGTLASQGHLQLSKPFVEQASDGKANLGVAAYMALAITLWGRVIKYESKGGKEKDTHSMWAPQSRFMFLRKQTLEFQQNLPPPLKYTQENLQAHASAKTGNQFIFLHVAVRQILLFLHRFAVPAAPSSRPSDDMPQEFHQQAFQIAIDTAIQISNLLSNALDYRTVAPFMGYCAFTSSTVLAWAVFFGDAAAQPLFYKSLATNLRYLRSLKRYWGVLHFNAKNLREIYAHYKEVAQTGQSESMKVDDSIQQYGDWFGKFPHGVSRPGEEHAIPKDEVTFEPKGEHPQNHDKRSVEDFFESLAGPRKPAPQKRTKKSTKSSAPSSRRPSQAQAKVIAQTLVEPMQNSEAVPVQAAPTHGQRQLSYPAAPPTYQNPHLNYQLPFEQGNFEPGNSSLIPQLDRQIVYGAYAGHDPTSATPTTTLNALANASSNQYATTGGDIWHENHPIDMGQIQPMMMSPGDEYLGDYNSTAWFMPFNLHPSGDGNYGPER